MTNFEVMYYGMEGQPITLEEYSRLFDSIDGRRVAQTDLPGGVWVSTVLLGLDHNYGDGPPLIFETMVFVSQDDMTDLDCKRYATKEEALLGHEAAVTRWTGWTPGEPHPPDAEASILTQFIDAMRRGSDGTYTDQDSFTNDAMVVMYPKELADGLGLRAGPEDGPMDEEGGQGDSGGDPQGAGSPARSGGPEVQQPVPGDGDRDPG